MQRPLSIKNQLHVKLPVHETGDHQYKDETSEPGQTWSNSRIIRSSKLRSEPKDCPDPSDGTERCDTAVAVGEVTISAACSACILLMAWHKLET